MTLHSDARKLNWSMVGVIVALILQAATLIFWGGGINQRVASLERIVGPSLTARWPGWTSARRP
jgi:hypothetical protein